MAWFSTKALGNTVQTPYPVLSLLQHKKNLKTKRKLMGLHINSNSWYQVDNHIIFEIFECLKHSQYWRKPCITIVICLLTESNSQIYSLFYIRKEHLLCDELRLAQSYVKKEKKKTELKLQATFQQLCQLEICHQLSVPYVTRKQRSLLNSNSLNFTLFTSGLRKRPGRSERLNIFPFTTILLSFLVGSFSFQTKFMTFRI